MYCQYVCSLGIEPTTFALLTQCSTTEPQEHCTWWGVPNVNIKHMPLPILYRGGVMEALHNAAYSMQCLINSCFTKLF